MFLEIGRVKNFYHIPARIVEWISEYIFLISKNKQKVNKNTTKSKETKEKKRTSVENRLKKYICGRPVEDSSRNPHFREQEFFFWSKVLKINYGKNHKGVNGSSFRDLV